MFHPTFPVFDGHVCLGRRHNQRVAMEARDDLLGVMRESGIAKALVYHPHAVAYDTRQGNRLLLEAIAGSPELLPQFVVNLPLDPLPEFVGGIRAAGVRSLRACPKAHLYPFSLWVADEWLDWMAAEGIGLWLPMDQADPQEVYETVSRHPSLSVVLVGVHYGHHAALWALTKALPNLYVDLSRYDILDGVPKLIERIGAGRLLFGSNFPELDPEPYLFYLHRCGLSDSDLRAICHDNLTRLVEGAGR